MPIRRIEIPQDILDDAEKLGCNESPEETLALWLKRGHDTDENVSEAYEAFDVLVASEKVQNTGTIQQFSWGQQADDMTLIVAKRL